MNAQTVEWTPEVISQTVPRILKAKMTTTAVFDTFLYQILKCYLVFYLKQGLSKSNEFILRYSCLGIATLLIPDVIRDDPGKFACKKYISNSKKSFISLI